MSLTNPDANAIGRYTEQTPIGALFSDYLNLGLATVSAAVTAVKNRLTALEARTVSGIVQPLSLVNNFAAFGANQHILTNGMVHLTLAINQPSNGAWAANTVVGTMPVGRRPSFRVYVGGAKYETWVEPDGRVIVVAAAAAGQGFMAFTTTYPASGS